jgi:predicted kinase
MMILLVGLPRSGNTTVAKKLAREQNALRLTPDEWMIPLFGEPEADGKRDVLEGLMISLALQALRTNINVVLDFGCWAGTNAPRCSVDREGRSSVSVGLRSCRSGHAA